LSYAHHVSLAAINEVRTRGESCGGVVTCVVRRCPKGLGAPVFDKLEAELAKAMMSLPATKVGPCFIHSQAASIADKLDAELAKAMVSLAMTQVLFVRVLGRVQVSLLE
jgi:chorismate synthase